MYKQHVGGAPRRIAAKGYFRRLLPLAFSRQVHDVLHLGRAGIESPRKSVRLDSKLGVGVVPGVIGTEPIAVRGIIVGDGGKRLELDLAVGARAFPLNENDEPIQLVRDIFPLSKAKRLARAASNGHRTAPVSDKKGQLLHGLALDLKASWGGLLSGQSG